MAELCYPVFEEGQTLTREDLNLMRTFLDDRVRTVGRAVGFGISCGFAGWVDDPEVGVVPALHLDGGIAIDQNGEVLVLEELVDIALPPATSTLEFDFIKEGAGFVAVLHEVDETKPGLECGQLGCESHAGTVCRNVEVVVVPGMPDIADDFYELTAGFPPPLTELYTNAQFQALQAVIVAKMGLAGFELSTQAMTRLNLLATSGSEPTAVKRLIAAWMNQVLFAVLDLMRCTAVRDVGCNIGSAVHPGVALGVLTVSGGQWSWDSSTRHEWEPPAGWAAALFGRANHAWSVCGNHVDRIESIIKTFEKPTIGPNAASGDKPADYAPCGKLAVRDAGSRLLAFEDCGLLFAPPETIPEDWIGAWAELQPGFGLTEPTPPWWVYGSPEPDWFEHGLIDVTKSYGHDAAVVKSALEQAINTAGVTPDVRVATASEAGKIAGFSHAAAVSPADSVVLIVDGAGKVSGTGHVPAQFMVQAAVHAVPAAAAAATTALETAKGMATQIESHGTIIDDHVSKLGDIGQRIDSLTTFETKTNTVLEQFDDLDGRIAQHAREVFAGFQTTVSPLLDNAVLDAVTKIEGRFALDIEQQTAALLSPVKEQLSGLGERIDFGMQSALQAHTRIDNVLVDRTRGLNLQEPGRGLDFNAGMVEFFQTMRMAVEKGATERQLGAVQAELEKGAKALGRMEAGVRAGALVLEDEGAALSAVLDSLVGALEAAGASGPDLEQLQAQAKGLQEKLR